MESFIGFVHIGAFTFAPVNYYLCSGQVISIAQNTALFSLIGTFYGGDGRTSMGIPDLRARTPVGSSVMGSPNPPLLPISIGQRLGYQSITLSEAQMPTHTHSATFTSTSTGSVDLQISTAAGTETAGAGYYFANGSAGRSPVKGFVKPADAGTTVSAGGEVMGALAGGQWPSRTQAAVH